jgi:hypothetical protein
MNPADLGRAAGFDIGLNFDAAVAMSASGHKKELRQ